MGDFDPTLSPLSCFETGAVRPLSPVRRVDILMGPWSPSKTSPSVSPRLPMFGDYFPLDPSMLELNWDPSDLSVHPFDTCDFKCPPGGQLSVYSGRHLNPSTQVDPPWAQDLFNLIPSTVEVVLTNPPPIATSPASFSHPHVPLQVNAAADSMETQLAIESMRTKFGEC
jgi:hypothetical protein